MTGSTNRLSRHLWSLVPLVLAIGCGLPRDQRGACDEIWATGTLKVGVTDAPPWIVREENGQLSGPEAELVRAWATAQGVQVEWHWGAADENLRNLEDGHLHIVAAGFYRDSPWKQRVAFTTEHPEGRVLAVRAGENRLLARLDSFIRDSRENP